MIESSLLEAKSFYENLGLKPGLNAVLLPDFGNVDQTGKRLPNSTEETLSRLQGFLDQIQAQGGQVVAAIKQEVIGESGEQRDLGVTKEQTFLVVHKPQPEFKPDSLGLV